MKRLVALVVIACACGEYDCESDEPTLDVAIRIGALEVAPASLDLSAELAGQRFTRRFDVTSVLSDGQTSLRIKLGDLGAQPVDVLLTARAFAEPDGGGQMLAETSHVVAASPDACNEVIIDLFPQRLVCEATCTADCRGADVCPVSCTRGARCAIDCRDSRSCGVTCDRGSTCSVDCSGGVSCADVRCGVDAACAVRCSPGAPCGFAECAGIERTCDDGTIVCNARCT